MNDDRIKQLEDQVARLLAWMDAREAQALPYPLDDASRASLGTPTVNGSAGIGLTTTINVPSVPASFQVPKAYSDTIIIEAEGVQYVVPILDTL